MPPPIRLAAGLLLVYPALILVVNVRAAVLGRTPHYLLEGLLLALFLIAVGVYLWRGRRWAYAAALVCSAALAAILVLYEAVVWRLAGDEMWEGWTRAEQVLHFVPVAALLAAFALLVREPDFGAARRRTLGVWAAAFAVELVLMALIARFGVGSPFGGNPWFQDVLSFSQVPGEMILTQMGMCCGYANHTIISDWFTPHWGGITRDGIPVLVTANALGLVPLFSLIRAALARRSRARGAAPAVAA
ncbi:hypothetical protein [Longimicrobium sp.]|uniref:hypothetical protein n=1 Tax=Longimicrobium sp. TaxID=2029185 RepID=UPI003B3B2B61